jgi:hypothetical protein
LKSDIDSRVSLREFAWIAGILVATFVVMFIVLGARTGGFL